MIAVPGRIVAISVAFLASAAGTADAQGRRGGPPTRAVRAGTIEQVTVGGREAAVYLPPSYASDAARRFPVVYLIAEGPLNALKLPEAADRLAIAQGFSEPIVVAADATAVLAADSEKLVADDLVASVDTRYRTIAARISRGLAGVSTGGDSALRTAMKRTGVFSSLHLMNASIAETTLTMLDDRAGDLRRYYAIAIDVGTKDSSIAANRRLHDAMTRASIPHYYEEYEGDHADKVSERVSTRLLPFFSKNLAAPANPTSPAVQ